MRKRPGRFFLYSLGCPKNLIDSEWLSGRLMGMGWKPVKEPAEADAVIVNTCSFIESAVQETIDAILTLHETAPDAKLIVTGCFPLRYGKTLRKLLPEVTTFFLCRNMETVDTATIDAMLSGQSWIYHHPQKPEMIEAQRTLSTPFYTAYVKIADGCNRRCAFCTLPAIRGKYRSRPLEAILHEVKVLVQRGVKEIILVAQDTAAYGMGLNRGTNLAFLLDNLANLKGLTWLKLLYLYPDIRRVGHDLVGVMAQHSSICPVVDVPVQHAAPNVLRRMKRPGIETIRRVLDRLRTVPDVRLRTTVMVGFPGETDADFALLRDFVKEQRFYSLGVFPYSDEEGTRAFDLPGKISEKEKERRVEELMACQQEIALRQNRELIGSVLPVLVEGPHEETELLLRGRTAFQFPEIDGCVLISEGVAEVGQIVSVSITDAGPYDLVGGILET
jgi:ribosomal protein S12 methylthiotransferase